MDDNNKAKRSLLPTGDTPNKPSEKRLRNSTPRSKARKPLQFTSPSHGKFKSFPVKSPVRRHHWTLEEERALVEFIFIAKTDPDYGWPVTQIEWPGFKEGHKLWEDASMHIQEACHSNFTLPNGRVRSCVRRMKQKFPTVDEAEEHYGLSLASCLEELDTDEAASYVRAQTYHVDKFTQTKTHAVQLEEEISKLSNDELVALANSLFLN